MGTRSLTFVYTEHNEPIMNMYRQYDGYPTGHGAELAEFLLNCNHNGMSCLAASMLSAFKESLGSIYIYPIDSTDCNQEYEYHVYENRVEVYEINFYGSSEKTSIFSGSWEELKKFCSNPIEQPAHAFDTQDGKDWLKSVLGGGVATVTFTKNDGTERVMKCTLDRKVVPQVVKEETKKAKAISDDVLPVYDIEAQGWRSFRWDSVKTVDISL